MKKNGFTLIELLAVIILVALLAGIGIPSVMKIIQDRKNKLYESTIEELKSIAKVYATNNPETYLYVDSLGTGYVSIETLCEDKYITCPVIDPRNNSEMTGSVKISVEDDTYAYEYTNYVPSENESLTDQELYALLLELDEKIRNFENEANDKLKTIEDNITSADNTYDSFNSNYKKDVYPVGSIYISYNNTNPGTLFGGTWEAFGSGRTLVGINTGDTDFNTVGKTGGAKTVTLAVSQLPSHTHTFTGTAHSHVVANSNVSALAATSGFDIGISSDTRTVWTNSGTADKYFFYVTKASYKGGAGERNTNAITTAGSNANTGGSGAHNNLQPYIVTYMWKRTA